MTLWVLLCVNRGVLAGLGRYRVVGLSIAGEAAGRLVLGLGLVLAGLGTTGAYLGTPLAMALAALVLGRVLARAPAAGRTMSSAPPPRSGCATSCATPSCRSPRWR